MIEEPKDIQVVEGDGTELNISPVYDHINNIQQPRKKQVEEIVIPEVKKKEQHTEKDKEDKPEDEQKEEKKEENDEN